MRQGRAMDRIASSDVHIEDRFWLPRLRIHKEVTLRACIAQCESTGRIANFEKAAGLKSGAFEGMVFNDSDVYKVLEGIAYSLMNEDYDALEREADIWIEKIALAQRQDGYLNTYFTLEKPDETWTDTMAHEDYCLGHLVEAAIAYHEATGKSRLLDVANRFVDQCLLRFGEGKTPWITGHQEIELALIKLYRATGDTRYSDLALWFVEQRGHGHEITSIAWDRNKLGGAPYNQDDLPVRRLQDIRGHAVRAMYYFAAVTDLAFLYNDDDMFHAIERLWNSTVLRNMYLTGGIGSSVHNEGFTVDYDLPNESAYCETCSSVGMVYWNHRLSLMAGDSKYADIIERCLYNGILSGVSLDGRKYFYVNPLESKGDHHREEWFGCSCCPTQIARFLPSIGEYFYAADEGNIRIDQYVSSRTSVAFGNGNVSLAVLSGFPWNGDVTIRIDASISEEYGIRLRIPGWCRSFELTLNGQPADYGVEKGYAVLTRTWSSGDCIDLHFDMPIERIYSDSRVAANRGKVALMRGPIVYCLEETDNRDIADVVLDEGAELGVVHAPELLSGVVKILVNQKGVGLSAVPYYAWDNRAPGWMKIWIPESGPEAVGLYGFCPSREGRVL